MPLTDQEKWFFDLTGYLVLRDAVPRDDVARMIDLCDRWHALPDEKLPPPLATYRDPSSKPTTARAICEVDYGDEVFQRLVLNREIMRVVLALTDNCPQLLNVALTRNTKESDDIPFHSGFEGGIRNPANDYQAANGRVFATFVNAAVSLVDVPEGSGFVCIPGTHKASFPYPKELGIYDGFPVVNVPAKAGDVVVFTEALRHGGRKWTLDTPRRTVFVRYGTSYASWSPDHGPIEAYRDKVPVEVYELHQRCGFQARKAVVKRLLKELGEV
jgi:hypothetical protein